MMWEEVEVSWTHEDIALLCPAPAAVAFKHQKGQIKNVNQILWRQFQAVVLLIELLELIIKNLPILVLPCLLYFYKWGHWTLLKIFLFSSSTKVGKYLDRKS